MILCTLPLRIISEANMRQHWRKAAERKKQHRSIARLFLQQYARPIEPEHVKITLTRIAPRTLDDDNLASGFKACRDGVADWLGIDDGDKRLTWVYAQNKGKAGHYAAGIKVEWN